MTYDCLCRKCHNKYVSLRQEDLDGDGFCENCKKSQMAIAADVDRHIAQLRAAREKNPLSKVLQPNLDKRFYFIGGN